MQRCVGTTEYKKQEKKYTYSKKEYALLSPLFFFFFFSFLLSFSLHLHLSAFLFSFQKKSSMEFLLELFLTVVCSLTLAFLFATLLQKASAAEDVEQKQEEKQKEEEKEEESTVSRRRRRKRSSEEKKIGGFDGEMGKDGIFFGGDELKNRGLEIEKRVVVVEVGGEETMVVDKFEGDVGLEGLEMGHGGEVELEELVDVSAIGSKDDDEVVVEKEEEEIKIVQVEKEVKDAEGDEIEEKLVLGSSEEVRVGLELAQDEHVEVIEEEDQEIEVEKIEGKCEEKESLFSDEDDWEGIERSEMEKIFGAASTFVGSGENIECLSKLGSDVQMQLYGLNKVANEGPCHESQPLAIMVSSRAKWHAWQRLGNMSPEVAMEAYIALLSDNVPGWMGENPDGGNNQNTGTDSPEAEVSIITKDHNLNSSPNQKPVPENERKQGVQGNDAMGGPEHQ